MNIKTLLFPVLLCLLTLSGCEKLTETETSTGKVQFSMSQSDRNALAKSQSLQPYAILLTIEDSQGNIIESNKVLNLFALGTGYISDNLSLTVGKYTITQFAVLDDGKKIIYATPVEGSALAQFVTDPLPIEFTVSKDNVSTIIPQVIAVQDSDSPEDFGFVNFGFEIIDTTVASLKKLSSVTHSCYDSSISGYRVMNTIEYEYSSNGNLLRKNVYGRVSGLLSHQTEYFYSNNQLRKIDLKDGKGSSVPYWSWLFENTGSSTMSVIKKMPGTAYYAARTTAYYSNPSHFVFNEEHPLDTLGNTWNYLSDAEILDGNLNSVHYYNHSGKIELNVTFSSFDTCPNPLFESYTIPDYQSNDIGTGMNRTSFTPLNFISSFNKNNPKTVRYEWSERDAIEVTYSYVYGEDSYPASVILSSKDVYKSGYSETTWKVDFIYQ